MIWDEDVETLERPGLERLQLDRLRQLLTRVRSDVPHYRDLLDAADVRSLDDVGELPFTGKQTLRDHYRFGMLAVPLDDIVRIHTSSGTLARMSQVLGRTDDMLVIRGVNVFPSQIEESLLSFDELAPQYVIVADRRDDHLGELEVRVEGADADHTGAELERSQGKALRVVDRRQLH